MNTRKKKRKIYTTTRMIALGFFCAIVVGTILLSLPIASKNGHSAPFMDTLFVTTSATCVTGLSTVVMAEQWSIFGQIVLLILIQLGGLGIVTFTTLILLMLGKRISLRDRMLIQEAYNLDRLEGMVRITKRVVKGALTVEFVGAVLYSIQFLQDYSFGKAIWFSVFHAVSAFCNAGIDLLGGDSLVIYRDNVLVNAVTMMLIILGGLGFPVWWDISENIKDAIRHRRKNMPVVFRLKFHSRLVLITTAVLIASGAIVTLILEYTNPNTLGELPFGNKVLASLFESVTLRTAGFQTIPQANFEDSTCLFYLVLMMIGGSPSGTAGGIKTITFVLAVVSIVSITRGNDDTEFMGRKVSDDNIRKAYAVFGVSFGGMLVLTMLVMAVQHSDFLDTLYEMVSAVATVGLSRGLTGELNNAGKFFVTIAMYLGRIGPISMALMFNAGVKKGRVAYPEADITVG